MGGCLQGDLPPPGQRALVLLQRIASVHALGQILLQAVIAASAEITQPVRTVPDLRPDGLEDVATLRIGLGVLQGCDSPLSTAQVDRSGLQGVRRILRVQRAVLEARAQHLRTRLECLCRRAVPVLTDICDGLLQQIPHTAVRRITGQLVMHEHPVVGDLIDLVRLRVAHHGLQCLKRMA
ncbi:hypothetical protein [Streptomyces tubercidicus]|uniref:hypothetical protein n=1 Tax=Streptomyces tubercidicus TaxID=47759 RepID=UPI002E0E8A38|nr:hypothetical protein OG761_29555 [Streptomyces tubercidicus]WSX19731.1 hypothetical protein OG690_07835 [Streptomyces tubercidicus]